MSRDGRYTAVLDRFEGNQAVLLIERDGDVVDERLVDGERLPEEAGQDAVFELTIDSGTIRDVEYLPEETERRTRSAQERFDRLSQRPPSGRDDETDDEDDDDEGR